MDPNACLQRIADATTAREQREACADLYFWLRSGGFEPRWADYPTATKTYRRYM